jgi:hypothetical protein
VHEGVVCAARSVSIPNDLAHVIDAEGATEGPAKCAKVSERTATTPQESVLGGTSVRPPHDLSNIINAVSAARCSAQCPEVVGSPIQRTSATVQESTGWRIVTRAYRGESDNLSAVVDGLCSCANSAIPECTEIIGCPIQGTATIVQERVIVPDVTGDGGLALPHNLPMIVDGEGETI